MSSFKRAALAVAFLGLLGAAAGPVLIPLAEANCSAKKDPAGGTCHRELPPD